jgi:hypothetical protein
MVTPADGGAASPPKPTLRTQGDWRNGEAAVRRREMVGTALPGGVLALGAGLAGPARPAPTECSPVPGQVVPDRTIHANGEVFGTVES